MKQKIESINIKGFRSLRDFSAKGFGRVNLFTGRNNTGKSSILEALNILGSNGSIRVIFNILRFREEDAGDLEQNPRLDDSENPFQLSSLFSGFPQIKEEVRPIEIQAGGSSQQMEIALKIGWLSRDRDPEGNRRFLAHQPNLPIPELEEEGFPVLMVKTPMGIRHMSLDSFPRLPYRSRIYRSETVEEPRMQCVYVTAYGGESTSNLGKMWDSIALSDREKDVVSALQIIDPEISAVSMVGGEGSRQTRTAIVRSEKFSRPVPLRSFGDGLNRLFGIVLSLVNAKEGLLLIDEFENGMHHTVQLDAWRIIFRLAKTLNVQVFATSHSWDAIEAFQKAASETPENGVLIRLTRNGEDIIPTLFGEKELAIATRDRIEVR